jgi:hypothetical protein
LAQDTRGKRRVTVDLQFADESIASAVAGVFTRSELFWEVVKDPQGRPISLVPCGRRALALVGLYLQEARQGLARAAERGYSDGDARAVATLGVSHLGLVMVWGEGKPPLTPRVKLPRFPQIAANLGFIERILARTCAVEGCRWPVSGEPPRRASERPVCCKDCEPSHGALIRRRVRKQLVSTHDIIDRGLCEDSDRGRP